MTRIYLIGAVALLLIVTHAGVGVMAWRESAARAEREHQAAGLQVFVDAVRTASHVGREIAAIGRQLSAAIEDSRSHERTTVVEVRRITDANPDFAAVRRPADLDRLRREQLERVARAATEADRLR